MEISVKLDDLLYARRMTLTDLADRVGIETPLPSFFEFPVGTMFWARPQALMPLLAKTKDSARRAKSNGSAA